MVDGGTGERYARMAGAKGGGEKIWRLDLAKKKKLYLGKVKMFQNCMFTIKKFETIFEKGGGNPSLPP